MDDVIKFLKGCVYAGSTMYRTAMVDSVRYIGKCSRDLFDKFMKYDSFIKVTVDNHTVHIFLKDEKPFYLFAIDDNCYLSSEIIWGVY